MGDLLRKGSDWLQRTQRRHAAQVVTYCRGGSAAIVPATIGESQFELQSQEGGFLTKVQTRDYLIDVNDLSLDEVRTEPKSGDRIVECDSIDNTQRVYEVTDVPNEPSWRYADPYRRRYRIHTKYIGIAPVP